MELLLPGQIQAVQNNMFPLLPMGRFGVINDCGIQRVVKLSINQPLSIIQELLLPQRVI